MIIIVVTFFEAANNGHRYKFGKIRTNFLWKLTVEVVRTPSREIQNLSLTYFISMFT